MSPADIARRRAAKRFNERLKLLATFLNNTGIATLAGGLVIPFIAGAVSGPIQIGGVLSAAVTAHIVAQTALTFIRSED